MIFSYYFFPGLLTANLLKIYFLSSFLILKSKFIFNISKINSDASLNLNNVVGNTELSTTF
ncbi:hypothetical protein BTO15_13040 [Polaribacter sejongensis]|uniref:Uncharacterized protein n=1 Tax=Polaribacter sejongensis TaxID=985043 RepID=A0ABN5F787_9FLAO|nr:hypothetical protein BTO15_13040 [Polaribacter sejongensis]